MDDVARVHEATTDAVAEVTPTRLRDVIDDRLDTSSMVPGVLALASARVADVTADGRAVDRRAAGVQLIYEGLRLTRSLVHEEPWLDAGSVAVDVGGNAAASDSPGTVDADVDVLAADVLVARGFKLLASTDAAPKAVETVRAFGREETDPATPDQRLEANVFELAAIAGATASGGDAPLGLRQYVVGLARSLPRPLPPATEALPETFEDVMGRVSAGSTSDDRAPSAGSINRND